MLVLRRLDANQRGSKRKAREAAATARIRGHPDGEAPKKRFYSDRKLNA